jgi:D-galactose 1-dehydrogenase
MTNPIRLAIVGLGKIARDQHLPTLAQSGDFELTAIASLHGRLDLVPNFASLSELIASNAELDAVALCTPPQGRYAIAKQAIDAGLHVMLEKPPAATLAEAEALKEAAQQRGVTLFATWHSREAAAVAPARLWLAGQKIRSVGINWKEDVRRWHPGQTWIWEPGGMGVFDPGINALSILTALLPEAPFVTAAELQYPSNCQAPIRAKIDLTDARSTPIRADFDFLQTGEQTWEIIVETDAGQLHLSSGGSKLDLNGERAVDSPDIEYAGLYRRFAELIRSGQSDVDLSPFRLVADAFMLGRRIEVELFYDNVEQAAVLEGTI